MRRWRIVTMQELERVWARLRRAGNWYNGCTTVELNRMYGAGKIKRGKRGWLKLV